LQPGQSYLVEVVIRTLGLGHHLTQGTVDSNEIWVDFQARSGDRELARNGALQNNDDSGPVDPWSHFINVLMLDRDGNRINRRNPQDIFTPLYDKQIPPGAGQVVHYRLDVPADVSAPIELKVRVRYRKFDYEYLALVHKDQPVPALPIVDLCEDTVTLGVAGVQQQVPEQTSPIQPAWQRWNDYGIGCFLEGGLGSKKGELLQAEAAFRHLTTLDNKDARWNGHVNRARVFIDLGRLDDAADALNKAAQANPDGAWWTLAWFNGIVNAENATSAQGLDAAIADFERLIDPKNQPRERKFDFVQDYVVLTTLGRTLFKRALTEADNDIAQDRILRASIQRFQQALALDSENLEAHYGMSQALRRLGRLVDLPEPAAAAGSSVDQIATLVEQLLDRKASDQVRRSAAGQLIPLLASLREQTPQPNKPQLPVFKSLIAQVQKGYDAETDPGTQAVLALVLGRLHGEVHLIYKPDDHARARATRLYREAHPAANHAAEAIVLYPTTPAHRAALQRRLEGSE
jgi:tetratricopeptide (TPR) repeat protein